VRRRTGVDAGMSCLLPGVVQGNRREEAPAYDDAPLQLRQDSHDTLNSGACRLVLICDFSELFRTRQ
jgi:hypothetical protein